MLKPPTRLLTPAMMLRVLRGNMGRRRAVVPPPLVAVQRLRIAAEPAVAVAETAATELPAAA